MRPSTDVWESTCFEVCQRPRALANNCAIRSKSRMAVLKLRDALLELRLQCRFVAIRYRAEAACTQPQPPSEGGNHRAMSRPRLEEPRWQIACMPVVDASTTVTSWRHMSKLETTASQ